MPRAVFPRLELRVSDIESNLCPVLWEHTSGWKSKQFEVRVRGPAVRGYVRILKETVHLQENIKQIISRQVLYLICEE